MRWLEIEEVKGMKTMFGKRVPNCVKNENASSGIFQTILVNLLQKKYPEGKFDIQGDKVTSEDGKLSVIADTAVEDGYGGVWVWDVDTGPYKGVLGTAIKQATAELLRQQPDLKPALFVDGDNQNPEAWSAIANKLNYTLIDEGTIEEATTQVWSRQGTKNVRKFRCTSGPRKGRVVSKPSTCTAPKKIAASQAIKKTKKRLSSHVRVKTKRTKKYNPASIRLRSLNKRRKSSRKRKKL